MANLLQQDKVLPTNTIITSIDLSLSYKKRRLLQRPFSLMHLYKLLMLLPVQATDFLPD